MQGTQRPASLHHFFIHIKTFDGMHTTPFMLAIIIIFCINVNFSLSVRKHHLKTFFVCFFNKLDAFFQMFIFVNVVYTYSLLLLFVVL